MKERDGHRINILSNGHNQEKELKFKPISVVFKAKYFTQTNYPEEEETEIAHYL